VKMLLGWLMYWHLAPWRERAAIAFVDLFICVIMVHLSTQTGRKYFFKKDMLILNVFVEWNKWEIVAIVEGWRLYFGKGAQLPWFFRDFCGISAYNCSQSIPVERMVVGHSSTEPRCKLRRKRPKKQTIFTVTAILVLHTLHCTTNN
jgi:hypothetical protein